MTDDNGPPGDGWLPWMGQQRGETSPETYLLFGRVLEIWHAEWGNDTSYVTHETMAPMTNVAGLYWRPA